MSNLIVLTVGTPNEARNVRQTLRELERAGRLSLDDAAAIRKDADGKLAVDDEVDRGVKISAGTAEQGGGIHRGTAVTVYPTWHPCFLS